MIVNQAQVGEVKLGKDDNIMKILQEALEAGYGKLPRMWTFKLYLERN